MEFFYFDFFHKKSLYNRKSKKERQYYMNYYNEIKQELVNNEVYKKIKDYYKNRNDLKTYYNVRKLLSEAGKHYGEGIISKYSKKLTNELNKSYNTSSLKRMRQFYTMVQKGATLSHQLAWSHYVELLSLRNLDKINYYIKITEDWNLSVRELRQKIKNKEYERLDDKTKEKLINKEDNRVEDFIKNPILIKNKFNTNNTSEKMLQRLILEDIPSFLKELGVGFSFIENEYKIKIGNRYNYNATLGIILCKKDNKFILEYVTGNNVIEREYVFV